MTRDGFNWLVRFANFEADLSTGELFRDGKRLWIQNIPFRVLEVLLRSGGELVERERMLGEVWSGAHVDQRSINTAIRKLRSALDDDAGKPRVIETVGTRGHRLMVPAQPCHPEEPGSFGHDPVTVAVFPFQNHGPAGSAPFSNALTDQLIVQLGRYQRHLSVIVPTGTMRAKNPHQVSSLSGGLPQSDYQLNGSVLAGTRNLRITARLVRTRDRVCVWSESYAPRDRDVLEIQEEITFQIAHAVLRLLPLAQAAPLRHDSPLPA
jgi:TolB-like protein